MRAVGRVPVSSKVERTGAQVRRAWVIFCIAGAATMVALLYDLLTPTVVSGGFFYILIVLAGFWAPSPRVPFALAVLTTVLIVFRVYLSPQADLTSATLLNRASDIGTVWLATVFVWYIRELSARLQAQVEVSNTLAREMAHRVGNSLQLVSVVLRMQAARVCSETARQVLRTAGLHVTSIGRIHRMLSYDAPTAAINSRVFIETLVAEARTTIAEPEMFHITVEADAVPLTSTAAITLGAVLIELVGNALKHAFRAGEGGALIIRFSDRPGAGQCVLEVEDDGVGMGDTQTSEGLGMRSLIELVRFMNASITWEPARSSDARPGTRWRVVFVRQALASPGPKSNAA
jgi:two-component sensor histidine kinase